MKYIKNKKTQCYALDCYGNVINTRGASIHVDERANFDDNNYSVRAYYGRVLCFARLRDAKAFAWAWLAGMDENELLRQHAQI